MTDAEWNEIRTRWAQDAQERADAIALQTELARRGYLDFGHILLTKSKQKPRRLHK